MKTNKVNVSQGRSTTAPTGRTPSKQVMNSKQKVQQAVKTLPPPVPTYQKKLNRDSTPAAKLVAKIASNILQQKKKALAPKKPVRQG